jgi:hypothetical protein
MPIDLAAVHWLYVAVLAIFVFIASFVGNVLSFHHRGMAAVLSALAFAALFVAWTYYPHGLPLPTALTVAPATTAAPAPAAPVAPPKPRNPVTDVTPR